MDEKIVSTDGPEIVVHNVDLEASHGAPWYLPKNMTPDTRNFGFIAEEDSEAADEVVDDKESDKIDPDFDLSKTKLPDLGKDSKGKDEKPVVKPV